MDAPNLAQIATLEMRANGFEPVFAPEVLSEAERRAGPQRSGDIRDLRGRQWFSLDNIDTLDLDQLTWAEAFQGDGVRLAVAVADVDAMVLRWRLPRPHCSSQTLALHPPESEPHA